ncbi:MAG: FG-GAP repeat protein [Planctomycetes bacterium]|nr:FG-GAP repeat protein [Planctomycetota bacterium]MBI3846548.1 FG-GAP repeat protein [Planctomycetota bacterium]
MACATARAQETRLFELRFDRAQAAFGSSVSALGDLDGDGFVDVLAAAPFDDFGGRTDSGTIVVISGRDGTALRRFEAHLSYEEFGAALAAAGDADGDGSPDFVVGAPGASRNGFQGAGYSRLVNAQTRATVWEIAGASSNERLGSAIARIGDLDGDGVADFAIGAPGKSPGGRDHAGAVILVSGRTGSIVREIDGAFAGDQLGASLARLGDVDGDHVPDVLAGAPTADAPSRPDCGSVRVFSGATGGQIFRFDGPESGISAGASVAGLGDVNGDGVPDVLVGAPRARPGGRIGAGSAFVLSGATGGILRRLDGAASNADFGAEVCGAGDVDGDGLDDVAIGAPRDDGAAGLDAGIVYFFSGATGASVLALEGLGEGDRFGAALADVGDVTGDHGQELLVGAPSASPSGLTAAGAACLVTFDPVVRALAGRVDTGHGGSAVDVLFVNGGVGGPQRLADVDRTAPFAMTLSGPPSRVGHRSRYVLYGWLGLPTRATLVPHPLDLGSMAFATPISGGSRQPRVIFNTLGHEVIVGTPTLPSAPAPTTIVSLPPHVLRAADATLQGIIKDENASNTLGVSITNGIRLRIR